MISIHREVSDGIKGGSERLMDNVPVSDLKRGDDVPVANTTNNAENSTTTNSSSTHSDNNSKTDQSQTHHNVVKHGMLGTSSSGTLVMYWDIMLYRQFQLSR
uniref:Membrane protein, putative n=1 Tax=Babesia bovis TaxID=5865 RepID=S6BNB7_BABBO|nr:membrane protein, putative [Babesia bovis]